MVIVIIEMSSSIRDRISCWPKLPTKLPLRTTLYQHHLPSLHRNYHHHQFKKKIVMAEAFHQAASPHSTINIIPLLLLFLLILIILTAILIIIIKVYVYDVYI